MDLINLIEYLYWNEDNLLSHQKIADLLGCGAEFIRMTMIKNEIPIRNAHDPYYNKLRSDYMKEKIRDYHKDPEFKRKLHLFSEEVWDDPDFRSNIIEKMKKYRNKPEVKEARSTFSKKLWNTPDMRKKIIKAMYIGQLPRENSVKVLRTIRKHSGKSIAEITIIHNPEMKDFADRKNNKQWVKFRDHTYNSLLTLLKRNLITKETKPNTMSYYGAKRQTSKYYINIKGIKFLEQLKIEAFGKTLNIYLNIKRYYW